MLLLLALATSYLQIEQGLTHASSFALCFIPVSMLRKQGDMLHMRAQSGHVLLLMTEGAKAGGMSLHWLVGVIKTFIARVSAAFRMSRAKEHKREHGLGLQLLVTWKCISISVHFFVT